MDAQRPDPVTFIQPSHGWRALGFGEVWEYRDLLYFLVRRDVAVRYKQAALGVAWAITRPFFIMVVFSIFLGRLAKLPSGGILYSISVSSSPSE